MNMGVIRWLTFSLITKILIQIQSSCPTQYFTGQILRKQNDTGSWELCIFSHINHHNTKTKQNPEYNQTIGFLEKVGAVGGRRSKMSDIIYEHIRTNSASLSQTLHMAIHIDIQKYSTRHLQEIGKSMSVLMRKSNFQFCRLRL